MRRFILLSTLLVAVIAATGDAALAQDDLSKVEIKTEKLSDTVFMMTGAGGNLGLSIGEDAVFLIDDQFAPLTAKIQEAVAKLSKKRVKFVLNTHWHFDHTGGNENFGKTGAIIVAHENVHKRLSSGGLIEFLGRKAEAAPKAALPVVTFTQDISFHLNGEDIEVHHVPSAHTDGDAVVYFKTSNVLHMGDVFFNGAYPFIDTSSGGSVTGVIAAVDAMLKLIDDNTKIIPGHGPVGSKADLKAYRDMLAAISGKIRVHIRARKSLQQVIAAKPSAAYDAVWGKGFLAPEKFVEMLYADMKKPAPARKRGKAR